MQKKFICHTTKNKQIFHVTLTVVIKCSYFLLLSFTSLISISIYILIHVFISYAHILCNRKNAIQINNYLFTVLPLHLLCARSKLSDYFCVSFFFSLSSNKIKTELLQIYSRRIPCKRCYAMSLLFVKYQNKNKTLKILLSVCSQWCCCFFFFANSVDQFHCDTIQYNTVADGQLCICLY